MYSPSTIVVSNLAKEMENLASSNKIASTSNLAGSKVFVLHGTKDGTVNQRKRFKNFKDQYQKEFELFVKRLESCIKLFWFVLEQRQDTKLKSFMASLEQLLILSIHWIWLMVMYEKYTKLKKITIV